MEQLQLIKVGEETIKPEAYHITKANALIEANYRLSLTEQRIILLMASMVEPEDEDFKRYQIYVKDYMRIVGVERPTLYRDMVKMIDDLMRAIVAIRLSDEEILHTHWIQNQVIKIGGGCVDVTFDPELKPFLLHLKERFTTYRLENIIRLKSVYSIRIYELLKQYQGLGSRRITIEDLRKMLGIEPKEYPLYGNFKAKVLSVAYQEINEKTDIRFSFKEIKQGRKVYELEFTIENKPEEPKPDNAPRRKDRSRVRAEEQKVKQAEERQRDERREKIQAYISSLSTDELAELTREAEKLARAEGGAFFRNRDIPGPTLEGYMFEIAGKRISS